MITKDLLTDLYQLCDQFELDSEMADLELIFVEAFPHESLLAQVESQETRPGAMIPNINSRFSEFRNHDLEVFPRESVG